MDFGLSPTLMFLVAHSAAATMHRDPQAWALEQLEAVYGEPLPATPTGCATTDWLHDEYAHGAYAHIRYGGRVPRTSPSSGARRPHLLRR